MSLTEQQHEQRRHGIGSSDLGAVCGVNPFKDAAEVYAEKRGLVLACVDTQEEKSQQLPIRIGNIVEQLIADLYTEETGEILETREEATARGTLQHPTESWILSTPDRLSKSNPKLALEIKSVGLRMASGWDATQVDGIPHYVNLQAQHQLYVTGRETCDVAALIGGSEFRIFRVERDDRLVESALTIARRFWFDHVIAGVPPAPTSSESSRALLLAMHPKPTHVAMVDATAGQARIGAELLELKGLLKQAEEKEALLSNQLREAIGDGPGLRGPGWRATWNARAGTTLWKATAEKLAAASGLQLSAFIETAQPTRTLLVKSEKVTK